MRKNILVSAVTRITSIFLVLFFSATLVFWGIHLAPGSILDVIAGQATSPAVRAEVAAEWGLDQPLWKQYFSYMGKLLHGDLGDSYVLNQPVLDAIWERAPATLELAGASLLLAFALTFIVIVLTGTGSRFWMRVSYVFELFFVSSPSFWIGIILIYFVSFRLNWLPIVGENRFAILILPALTLALKISGELTQIMRSEISRILSQPFVLSARARGISDIRFSFSHALHHALLPVVSVSGWIAGNLLAGTFVIEELFGRTGIGTLTVKAVLSRDTPLVVGSALVAAAIYVLISAIADWILVLLDPRVGSVNNSQAWDEFQ